jgi:hypothetical protein
MQFVSFIIDVVLDWDFLVLIVILLLFLCNCSWARFAPMATIQLMTLEFFYSACGFKGI